MLTEELLRRLLATCAGKDFEARRDRALILLLLLDTGGRRAEIAGIRVADLDFEYGVVAWSARAAETVPCRSAPRPPERSTSTSAPAPASPCRP